MRAEGISHPAETAISVPRRLFKRAVDRNLLKRRIREAYRINKSELYTELTKIERQVYIMILYQDGKIADYQAIEKALKKAQEQMLLKLKKNSNE